MLNTCICVKICYQWNAHAQKMYLKRFSCFIWKTVADVSMYMRTVCVYVYVCESLLHSRCHNLKRKFTFIGATKKQSKWKLQCMANSENYALNWKELFHLKESLFLSLFPCFLCPFCGFNAADKPLHAHRPN